MLYVDAAEDLRDVVRTKTADFSPIEQDPVQILDALLPLYLNRQIFRASIASELAARMSAMSSATDNAVCDKFGGIALM